MSDNEGADVDWGMDGADSDEEDYVALTRK
jgi:hypothetical protein